jgi:rubrerythrin
MWTADRGCVNYFVLDGTFQSCGADDAGTLPLSRCLTLCPAEQGDASAMACAIDPPYMGGPALVACEYFSCGIGTGRRPEGLAPCESACGPTSAARTLAGMAHLEAASVHAFMHLARELEAHGAPDTLSRAARRAASDEVRHARDVTALAEGEGGLVPEVRTTEPRIRTLEGMAIENAVEGCVRETFGAAVAKMQAERAGDPRFRQAMRRIARDEMRHAELAWAVARWIDTRLDEAGRRRVHEARTRAVETLAREVTREPDASSMARLGVPSASEARAVVDALRGSLWATRAAA